VFCPAALRPKNRVAKNLKTWLEYFQVHKDVRFNFSSHFRPKSYSLSIKCQSTEGSKSLFIDFSWHCIGTGVFKIISVQGGKNSVSIRLKKSVCV